MMCYLKQALGVCIVLFLVLTCSQGAVIAQPAKTPQTTFALDENKVREYIQKSGLYLAKDLDALKQADSQKYHDLLQLFNGPMKNEEKIKVESPILYKQIESLREVKVLTPEEEKATLEYLKEHDKETFEIVSSLKKDGKNDAYNRLMSMNCKVAKAMERVRKESTDKYEKINKMQSNLNNIVSIERDYVQGKLTRKNASMKLEGLLSSYYQQPVAMSSFSSRLTNLEQKLTLFRNREGSKETPKELGSVSLADVKKEIMLLEKALEGNTRALMRYDIEKMLDSLGKARDIASK